MINRIINMIIDIMIDSRAIIPRFMATLPVVVSIGAKICYIRHSRIQILNVLPRNGISSLSHSPRI